MINNYVTYAAQDMNANNSQIQIVEQKTVAFAGTEILTVKATDEKVYVAVKWLCESIGLSEGQIKSERKRVKEDTVLLKGGRNFTLLTNGGMQTILCIELDYLPLWLAKIAITPNMKKETPWIADRLVEFQLKAKDVLAAAFFQKPQQNSPMTPVEILAQAAQQMLILERKTNHLEERQNLMEQNQQNIVEVLKTDTTNWRQMTNDLLRKIAYARGGENQYRDVRNHVYDLLKVRGRCDLERRLSNRQKNMLAQGMNKSAINKLSKIDMIAEEPRLIEVFVAIVKEMAIAHNVNF